MALFELLHQCWISYQVSLNMSVCGPFKWNTWDSSSHLSHSVITHAGFHSQNLWGLLLSALEPWLRVQVWGWDPLLLRGASAAKISLLILNHHTWVCD